MTKKKVTKKMLDDLWRAWDILSDVAHECRIRDVELPNDLHNITQSQMRRVIFELEESA